MFGDLFPDRATYWLTRSVFQTGMAVVYLIAFLVALNQFRPLLGERGLLPVSDFVKQVSFRETPSLFFFAPRDWAFTTAAVLGIVLSTVAILGLPERYSTWLSILNWFALWALYLSFVNVGQVFYGFGWESLLLEAGFLTIFLGSRFVQPQPILFWLFRWLEFRVMFGAGMIKIRGDACWRDYTCLDYHYETQPMPNPASWCLHWAPSWTHRFGVGFNHFAELIVPFAYFLPQPWCSIAGVITIVFQGCIMLSGNLSWLNFLTMILAIPLIDDRVLGLLIRVRPPALHAAEPVYKYAVIALAIVIALLSINPARNLVSSRQIMNTSWDPFHIVGSYGAFGSITRTRYEIVLEGTTDQVLTASTKWREYEFKGKPGATSYLPHQIAPYHLRLDWLMWFAAMSNYGDHPWFVHLVAKFLQGDRDTLSLLRVNPFPDRAPHFVRAELYEYHFTSAAEHAKTGQWWRREFVGSYFPSVSLDTPGFRRVLTQLGWL